MDTDLIAEYERLQKQAAALKRMKKVVDIKLDELQPQILEYGAQNKKDSISTGGGGTIVIKQRPQSVSSIGFKQIPAALKGHAPDADLERLAAQCKLYMTEAMKKKERSRYVEYLLPHPNMPGKMIQSKDIALPPVTEHKILVSLDNVMKTEKLEVCEAPPRKKRAKSAGPPKRAPKKGRKKKEQEQPQPQNQEEEEEGVNGEPDML